MNPGSFRAEREARRLVIPSGAPTARSRGIAIVPAEGPASRFLEQPTQMALIPQMAQIGPAALHGAHLRGLRDQRDLRSLLV